MLRILLGLGFLFCQASLWAGEVFCPEVGQGVDSVTFLLKDKVTFKIVLAGNSWLYHSCSGDSVRFVKQSYSPKEVSFTFEPLSTWKGMVTLAFFSQDNKTGKFKLLKVLLECGYQSPVLGFTACSDPEELTFREADSSEALINWANPSTWKKLSSLKLQAAIKQLSEWGDIKGAICLALEQERRGEKVSRSLGDLYYQIGDNKKAYRYYKEALREEASEELVLLSVLLAMLEEDSCFVSESLRYWLTSFPPPQEAVYLMVFLYLIEHELWDEAYRWAELYKRFYMHPVLKDKYFYLLATFLEKRSDYQNVRTALDLYDKILKDYPLSPYWKNSYDRLLALKSLYLLE